MRRLWQETVSGDVLNPNRERVDVASKRVLKGTNLVGGRDRLLDARIVQLFGPIDLSNALVAQAIGLILLIAPLDRILVHPVAILGIAAVRDGTLLCLVDVGRGVVVALFKIELRRALSLAVLSTARGHWRVNVSHLRGARLHMFVAIVLLVQVEARSLVPRSSLNVFKSPIHFVLCL